MITKEELLVSIEEQRDLMHKLIQEKEMLIDDELIKISQKLDRLINIYNRYLLIQK